MSASSIPPAGHLPPAFLQVLVELDENVTSTLAAEKKASKKMAATQAKAVNSIRQTLKKKVKELEQVLATYKEVRSRSTSHCTMWRLAWWTRGSE